MNEEAHTPPKSWIDKLSTLLAREPQDREQLVQLLRDAQLRTLLDADALSMIEGVLQVAEIQVRDIMIPRAQMAVVPKTASTEEIIHILAESHHSRYPVTGENRDEIVGVLMAKDLLPFCFNEQKDSFNLKKVLRPALFVPESKRLDVLLKEFRLTHNHMAIVADEYGGVAGLVTLEDVLEQIVGDIEDEHDIDNDSYIHKYVDNRFTVKALTPIEDFNTYFKTNFQDEDFDTIGGVVIHRFGHMPKRGDSVVIEDFTFKILHADNRRVHLLQVTQQ